MPFEYKNPIFFPFSLDIPWKAKGYAIIPSISKDIWNKYIKNKPISIVCPGYLLEAIVCSFAYYILNKKVDRWIIPAYYAKALELFGISCNIESDDNIFKEYDRLIEINKTYPSPIFFDKNKSVYFNMYKDYGNKITPTNKKRGRNSDPFWKQLLDNLCIENYEQHLSLRNFNYEKAGHICYKFLEKFGIAKNDKYYIIDATNLFCITADHREIESRIIFPIQIKEIVDNLKKQNIKCIVMADEVDQYKALGIYNVISSWNTISSDIVVSLITNAYGLISQDQNMYLLAMMFGVNNVICIGEEAEGWGIKDAEIFQYEKKNWEFFGKEKSISELRV